METIFYVLTIVIMLMCIVASTSCLASFAVLRRTSLLCLAAAFAFYFIDLTFIFQHEYLNLGSLEAASESSYYAIRDPYLKALVSAGVLESAWLALLTYLNKRNVILAIAPAAVFLLAIALIVELIPSGPARQWCYYTTREIFLVWFFLYIVYQARHAKSAIQKSRIRKLVRLAVVGLVLCLFIIAENTFMILIWHPQAPASPSSLLLFFSERNLSENAFILVFASIAVWWNFKALRQRRRVVPQQGERRDAAYTQTAMDNLCERYHLTARERDILQCFVEGKDYQNTASQLQLAVGTVKSHMHNIFKKTGTKSSTELLERFWNS